MGPDLAPVAADEEFWRIYNLPRRTWTPEQALAAAEALSPQLLNERGLALWNRCALLPPAEREAELERIASKPSQGGEGCPIRLLPDQAVSLIELGTVRGVIGSLPTSAGKTLFAFLAPHMLPDVQISVLMVPGGLTGMSRGVIGKTELEFDALKKFWRTPKFPIRVMSYDLLSRKEYKCWLCECEKCAGPMEPGEKPREPGLHPQFVLNDESDALKDPKSARTRRIMRYGSNHPDRLFGFITGTMMRKSLDDVAHQMILALKKGAPVPWPWHIRDAWKQAIDFSPKDGVRRPPGALLRLPRDGTDDGKTLDELAAEGVRKRWAETPGVIIINKQSCDKPIHIRLLKPPDDPILDAAFYDFRSTKKTPAPDCLDVSANLDKMRVGKQLSTGFYTKIVPRPPEEWYEARREAHKVIREAIANSERAGRPIDSEEEAFLRMKDHPAVQLWQEIKDKYPYKTEPVWMSLSVLGFAAEWMKINAPALIWTSDIPVGNALSLLTGVPYFGEGGYDADGNLLDTYDCRYSAIVSVGANKRGRNLQGWNRCLCITPPQNEVDWEQGVLGRVHRRGQRYDVYCDVIIASADSLRALDIACEVARHVYSRQGFAQKLLLSHFDWSAFPLGEIAGMSEEDPRKARWTFS